MKRTLVSYLVITSIFASAPGTDFQVNTRTSNNQTDADIAMDANGNFVVVWTSYGQDGSSNGIFGRRFDSNCSPMCDEFQINTTTSGNQKEPAVAMDSSGDFVVVWQGPQAIGDTNEDIFAQRFDANGQSLAGEFRVNTHTDSRQLSPAAAMDNDGKFIIVWECADDPAPGDRSIHGQLYDRFGSKIKNELTISDQPSICRYPNVAMNDSNEVIVVWTGGSAYYYVYVRNFPADGNEPLLNSKKVDDEQFSTLTESSITIDDMGNYVIAWDGRYTDSNDENIYIKRFHWSHAPLHIARFLVNTLQIGDQTDPSVAINDNSFIVVWEGDAESQNGQRDIFGQRFVNQGEEIGPPIPLGDEFQINLYEVNDQRYPDVAMRENGEFVSVWQSNGQGGSGYGIFGQAGPKVGSADFTGDGFVNFYDYGILAQEWLKEGNPLRADLVDDNKIDGQDLAAFCEQWLTLCYQCDEVDIYSDGKIDFKDYCLLATNWKKCGPNLNGDFTGNGIVDLADLKALTFHWAKTCEQ
ncbi:MAG: hypothetical protein ABSG99_09580 [Sedimentisphaerales bacterium]